MTVPGNLSSPLLAIAAAAGGGATDATKSLRFHRTGPLSGTEAGHLRGYTPSASDRRTWTWAAWIKRGSFANSTVLLFSAGTHGSPFDVDHIKLSSDKLEVLSAISSINWRYKTTAVFRDPAAWYHIAVAVDTTNSTEADRVKIFVNGTRITVFDTSSAPSLNYQNNINGANEHAIGYDTGNVGYTFDGYMADIFFIDGSALSPVNNFIELDSNGVYQKKDYTGTFGTNGFHLLDFANESTIGHDSSGNNNDFTANNFNATGTRGIVVNGSVSTTVSTEPFSGAGGAVGTGSTNDFIFVPASSDFSLSGEFTIEWFHYRSATNANNGFMFTVGDSNTSTGIELYWGSSGTVLKLFTNGNDSAVTATAATGWKHYAVVRDSSNNIKVYYNGVLGLTLSNSNTFSGDVRIGAEYYSGSVTGGMDGPMSNFRIVNGSAVYTSNFTPPTSALTAITNTKLLTLQGSTIADASGINFSAEQDVLFDAPVNGTQSDTGAGGEVSGNYATFNPLDCENGTVTNGNLTTTPATSGTSFGPQNVTIGVTSGKWYCEITWDSGTYALIGVTHAPSSGKSGTTWHRDADTYTWYFSGAFMSYLWAYGTSTFPDGTNPTFAVGDTVGVLLDKDNHKLYFTKNGSYVASMNAATGANGIDISRHSSETTFITCGNNSSTATQLTLNAGQRPFANSAPSGYKALCTTNLPTPAVPDGSTAFDVTTHIGNGSGQNVTGLSFKPDWVWVKCRSAAQYHRLVDSVRGVNRDLIANGGFTEQNQDNSNSVASFNSNGFTVGPDGAVNTNNETYLAWCWDVDAGSNKTYTVKVVSDSGNKYRFDNHGTSAVTLDLAEGGTYVFDQSDSSNSGHPLRFSTTSDGTHGGGSEYTTGVTATGTPGSAGAKTTIVLASGAATLYYYCTAHTGMGGQINTNTNAGSTRLSGSHSSYNQTQTFSTGISGSGSGGSFPSGEDAAKAFDGNLNTRCRWTGTSSPVLTASFTAISATKLRVRYHAWAQTSSDATDVLISVNGGSYVKATEQNFITYAEVHAADGQAPFVDISPLITGGQVSSVSVKRRSTVSTATGLTFYAIEIDDKILVDSGTTPPDVPAITARVNVSATQGISIGKYTGNDTRTATVPHDLGAKPDLIIVKALNKSDNWVTYHSAMGASYHGDMNLSGGFNSGGSKFASIEPTSNVFSLATDGAVNGSSYNYIFYAFAAVPGYSSFGRYEGNGNANGPFVHTGFRPAMVMVKNADGTGHWVIMDTTRDADNPMEDRIKIDASDAESNTPAWDALSNGFKIRSTYGFSNTNGNTYVYWAMAENPFQANGGLAR